MDVEGKDTHLGEDLWNLYRLFLTNCVFNILWVLRTNSFSQAIVDTPSWYPCSWQINLTVTDFHPFRKPKEWCQWVDSPQRSSSRTMYPWAQILPLIITREVCRSRCTKPIMFRWPRALWSSPLWVSRSLHLLTWASAPVPRLRLAGRSSVTVSLLPLTEIWNPTEKVRRETVCMHVQTRFTVCGGVASVCLSSVDDCASSNKLLLFSVCYHGVRAIFTN